MFIQTEPTPNPATLKFIPGEAVLAEGSVDFADAGQAARSPLARDLFEIDGVTRVFLGTDFISVSKADERSWQVLKPSVLGAIMEHFTARRPMLLEGDAADEEGSYDRSEEHTSELQSLMR